MDSVMEEDTRSSRLFVAIEQVRQKIRAAAVRSNRRVEEITLVAVSKTHPTAAVREAIAAGLTDFGENRVQEAEAKIPEVGRNVARWHLIGHLQSNKARRAVELFDLIHSLDSVDLARRLDRIGSELNRADLPVLIQVDLGKEGTKTGVEENALREVADCENCAMSCKRRALLQIVAANYRWG
jgi:pyridoxal phosphate enzyme (YggS family)